MAKINLNDHRDNEFLNSLFEIDDRVESMDLTRLSNDELQSLFDEAAAIKDYYDNLQQTVKQLANSIYGACGSEFFRFYNPEVAGDITTEGKMFMFIVDEVINKYFHSWESDPTIQNELQARFPDYDIRITNVKTTDICVYGDTDSRYVAMGDVMKAANFKPKNPKDACDFVVFMDENRLAKLIADGLHDDIVNRNGELGYMLMELETIGGKGIYLVKKKYVMSLFWKDGKLIADQGKIKATGVEINQASSSAFVKNTIKTVIKRLLTPGFKTENIYKIGNVLVDRAMAAPPDELLEAKGIGEYTKWVANDKEEIEWATTGAQAHVRAAAEYNHFLYVNNLQDRFPRFIGGKIHWAYALNKAGVFGVPDGVELSELPGAPKIDYKKQVEKLIITPIKRYLFNENIDKASFGQKEILHSFGSIKRV